MDEIFAVLYYNSIHKSSSFSMVFNGDSIVSKSEELLFFYPENVLQLFYTMIAQDSVKLL